MDLKMNDTAHGIMFHHFHDHNKHIVGQGSISSEDFENILDFYGKTHNIISAEDFLYKSQRNILSSNDVCITFDDGLLCQYDIAYPVLEHRGLTAFWFIYTSPLEGILEKLEIYRHFRFSKFEDIEDFYAAFFKIASDEYDIVATELKTFNPDNYLIGYPFYTPNDKRFRYLRDHVLGESRYNHTMDKMIAEYQYNVSENAKLLWMNSTQICNLTKHGHIIGLHSHTHPTVMQDKSKEAQKYEYGTNLDRLLQITRKNIISVSYPCNSYNLDTLQYMQELNIQVGFRANMLPERISQTNLEIPREDHSNILRAMKTF